MRLTEAREWIEAKQLRRVAAMAALAWIVFVISWALYAAHRDEMEVYRWTAMGLLLLGVPTCVTALFAFFYLLGRKRSILLISCAAIAVGVWQSYAYVEQQQRDRERLAYYEEQAEQQQRMQEAENFAVSLHGAECGKQCGLRGYGTGYAGYYCVTECAKKATTDAEWAQLQTPLAGIK